MRPIDADKLIEHGWFLQRITNCAYGVQETDRKSIADVSTMKFDELQKYLQDESFVWEEHGDRWFETLTCSKCGNIILKTQGWENITMCPKCHRKKK